MLTTKSLVVCGVFFLLMKSLLSHRFDFCIQVLNIHINGVFIQALSHPALSWQCGKIWFVCMEMCMQMHVGITFCTFGSFILNFKTVPINMLIQMRKAFSLSERLILNSGSQTAEELALGFIKQHWKRSLINISLPFNCTEYVSGLSPT